MNSANPSSKIYLDIVEKLRKMIEEDGLLPGDKISSERELSERLNVGRSSVREALRALELLGLIETRRGEGTFIKDFQEHRLVELLGTFFLQNPKIIADLNETKQLIEIDCLKIIIQSSPQAHLEELLHWAEQNKFDDDLLFEKIAELNRNKLIERIWRIVNSYSRASLNDRQEAGRETYIHLIKSILERNEPKTIQIYLQDIRRMSKEN
ncbi:FadR/GntR family transcriptional regulator [Bacillus sp. V59.32b]|uniref:FadR/GntR family transcriptional regulator n=1 Tax=Bacillus sp. V59.32b TaxID=1758642 RepID=UPI0020B1093B|nr:GntR family transcriptional regulator [Bacillus sp. V59.32b]